MTCKHLLALRDYDYTEYVEYPIEYSSSKDIKDIIEYDETFNFCPKCGQSVKGLLESELERYKALEEEQAKRKELERQETMRKRAEKAQEIGEFLNINNLDENKNYTIIFNETKKTYGKKYVVSGTREYIKDVLAISEYINNKEELSIYKMYENFTKEEMGEILNPLGFEETKNGFIKVENDITEKVIDYSEGGSIYVGKYVKKSYEPIGHGSIHDLEKVLGVKIPLKIIVDNSNA